MAHQVELKSGETYRGELHEAEDNWNCQLKNITATAKVWFNTVVTLLGQEPGAFIPAIALVGFWKLPCMCRMAEYHTWSIFLSEEAESGTSARTSYYKCPVSMAIWWAGLSLLLHIQCWICNVLASSEQDPGLQSALDRHDLLRAMSFHSFMSELICCCVRVAGL